MKILKYIFNRITFMAVMVILQLLILFAISHWFIGAAGWIQEVLQVISVLIVLYIIKNSKHLSSDMLWIVLIMIAPIPGAALYLFVAAEFFIS